MNLSTGIFTNISKEMAEEIGVIHAASDLMRNLSRFGGQHLKLQNCTM